MTGESHFTNFHLFSPHKGVFARDILWYKKNICQIIPSGFLMNPPTYFFLFWLRICRNIRQGNFVSSTNNGLFGMFCEFAQCHSIYTAVQYAKGTKFHLMYQYSAKTQNANLLEDLPYVILRHSAYKKQSFIPLVGKGTQSPYTKVHSFILRIMWGRQNKFEKFFP